jgi:hypothetical protein
LLVVFVFSLRLGSRRMRARVRALRGYRCVIRAELIASVEKSGG